MPQEAANRIRHSWVQDVFDAASGFANLLIGEMEGGSHHALGQTIASDQVAGPLLPLDREYQLVLIVRRQPALHQGLDGGFGVHDVG